MDSITTQEKKRDITAKTSLRPQDEQCSQYYTEARWLAAIMKRQTKNILTGIISVGLLTTLFVRLNNVPGGIILSGLALGTMWIILITLICLVLTVILKRIFKIQSFLTILFLTTSIGFTYFHYRLYSPTLTIVVPTNYSGEVDLVLANVTNNILTLDSNGIGYIDQWTFDRTYTRPIVTDKDGNNLDSLLIGFNPTSFWGVGKSCCIDNEEIYVKSFNIKSSKSELEFKNRILSELVNQKLVKTIKNDQTFIQTETTTTTTSTK